MESSLRSRNGVIYGCSAVIIGVILVICGDLCVGTVESSGWEARLRGTRYYMNVENVLYINAKHSLPPAILQAFRVYVTVPENDAGSFHVRLGIWRRLGPREQFAYILDYQQRERLLPASNNTSFPTRPFLIKRGSFIGFIFEQSTGPISSDWNITGDMDLSAKLAAIPTTGDVVKMTPLNYFNMPSVSAVYDTIAIGWDECALNTHNCHHFCINTCDNCDSFRCGCRPGFTLQNDSRTCQNTNECLVNNGGCDHFCHDNDGSHTCSCRNGYNLTVNQWTCEDFNECTHTMPCPTQGDCINTPGGYDCISLLSMDLTDQEAAAAEPLKGNSYLTENSTSEDEKQMTDPGKFSQQTYSVVWIAVNSIFVVILLASVFHVWRVHRRQHLEEMPDDDDRIETMEEISSVWTMAKDDKGSKFEIIDI